MRSEIRQGLNELRKHGIYIVFFTAKGRKSYLTPPASLVRRFLTTDKLIDDTQQDAYTFKGYISHNVYGTAIQI